MIDASHTLRLSVRQADALIDHCEGVYSKATLKSYRGDLQAFAAWCAELGEDWLPA
jgi:site-specific recombinase XerD